MPVEQANVVNIVCDNPSCPGNSLDAHDRTGWTFISTEVYGEPTTSHVFCSPECAGTITTVLTAQAEAKEESGLEGTPV